MAKIGVCYGMVGDNLPQPSEVIDLYKSNNFGRMRLYAPETRALNALRGTNIELILDVTNGILQVLANDAAAAAGWVKDCVSAYLPDVLFRVIVVGNEVIPSDQARFVLPAMQNIHKALSAAGLQDHIKVSTAIHGPALGASYPPSSGVFADTGTLGTIVEFLKMTGSPLLANVYPYIAYAENPSVISIEYALFTSAGTVVTDGSFKYQNLFDAMTDSYIAALEKVGGSTVELMVSETGWPSDKGLAATRSNAMTYNSKLIRHVGNGTPRRPGKELKTYIFSIFNENQKQPQGAENHFGLFYPNKTPVYPISRDKQTMGVCYGMMGDNLPHPNEVIDLYKSRNFGRMRLYGPEFRVFNALRGTNIELILDVTNGNLQTLANDAAAAAGWVKDCVRAFFPDVAFRVIVVGNEVIPSDQARFILPAMQNIHSALSAAGLQDQIKVSTAVHGPVLGVSYPPSAGAFGDTGIMGPIVQFLKRTGSPLLANVYPYFAHIDNPSSISIEYALFASPGVMVTDGSLKYQNLFDAMVDSYIAALEKMGGSSVELMVSETGWPSGGGGAASIYNARTYSSNLIKHVGNGTPRRPGTALKTYIFAMFNENQKQPHGTENYFGLHYPDKTLVYPID